MPPRRLSIPELAEEVARLLEKRREKLLAPPEGQKCQGCVFWDRITQEGSVGTPQKEARPGWGTCHYRNLQLVRVKGVLETQEDFWCRGWTQTHREGE